jgi:hypothetical protein
VIATTLPFAESSGRDGEMAGLGEVCQIFVREGNGVDVAIVVKDSALCWDCWSDMSPYFGETGARTR